MDEPHQLTSIAALSDGQMQLLGAGLSNVTYRIQAATNLIPIVQWSDIGTTTAGESGAFWFTDTNAPLFPLRFYRAATP